MPSVPPDRPRGSRSSQRARACRPSEQPCNSDRSAAPRPTPDKRTRPSTSRIKYHAKHQKQRQSSRAQRQSTINKSRTYIHRQYLRSRREGCSPLSPAREWVRQARQNRQLDQQNQTIPKNKTHKTLTFLPQHTAAPAATSTSTSPTPPVAAAIIFKTHIGSNSTINIIYNAKKKKTVVLQKAGGVKAC